MKDIEILPNLSVVLNHILTSFVTGSVADSVLVAF